MNIHYWILFFFFKLLSKENLNKKSLVFKGSGILIEVLLISVCNDTKLEMYIFPSRFLGVERKILPCGDFGRCLVLTGLPLHTAQGKFIPILQLLNGWSELSKNKILLLKIISKVILQEWKVLLKCSALDLPKNTLGFHTYIYTSTTTQNLTPMKGLKSR